MLRLRDFFIHPVLEIGRRGFPVDNLVSEFSCPNADVTQATNSDAFYPNIHTHKHIHLQFLQKQDRIAFERGGLVCHFFA